VTDFPGAFLHADMDKDIHMLLEGTIMKLIVKLEPKLYRKYTWRNKNNKPILYIKPRKAPIWQTAGSAAFWKLLSNTLKEWGLKINEYDQCVANKTINGKQCTIIWRVDDLNISHID